MNRTVRNVGALILSLILMMSCYGIYKGGVTATGNMAFNRMTKDVGTAFGKTKPKPNPNKPYKYGVTPNQWKRGVGLGGYSGGSIHVPSYDKDGHFEGMGEAYPSYHVNTLGIVHSPQEMEEVQREEQNKYIAENDVAKEDIPYVRQALSVYPNY